jgi:hypothetical protein
MNLSIRKIAEVFVVKNFRTIVGLIQLSHRTFLGIITQIGKNADVNRIMASISPPFRRIARGMDDAHKGSGPPLPVSEMIVLAAGVRFWQLCVEGISIGKQTSPDVSASLLSCDLCLQSVFQIPNGKRDSASE